MTIQTFLVDTFCSEKFRGNPTMVCLLTEPLQDAQLLSITREFNLPVTVFVEMNDPIKGIYAIRYFTVKGEIAACGHATLGAAFVLQEQAPAELIAFKTIEGRLVRLQAQSEIIWMKYAAFNMQGYLPGNDFLASAGLRDYKTAGYCTELETVFIECESPLVLRQLAPDFKKMLWSNSAIKELVVTSVSDQASCDYLLRSFCPWIGIDEDPVTGSVHSVLAGYWSSRLGKKNLKACQSSDRGGEINIKDLGSNVLIGGQAVLLLRGELFL